MSELHPTTHPQDFRDVPDYPGYKASRSGEVWSCRKSRGQGLGRGTAPGSGGAWHRLKPHMGNAGYLQVLLMQPHAHSRRMMTVHSVVLLAFQGPCPAGKWRCHNDGDRTNNAISNLRYDTPKGNHGDRDRHGTTARGERSGSAKLTADDVRAIRRRYAAGDGDTYTLADEYGVSQGAVFFIVSRRTWKHVA